ncbi:hypothetical protein K490DRAFT_68242 [Saccharata proteae CBS 121410]|uniref:Uncharacterized protein n=1 Tax=Saccharata proteae CBS 121410 TaxID=1314787 RepID=A0A9P4HQE7_9PEZI|nr:hypothetical protein K490DRAFT_68242 [Saccharata proteae CBS 121410]
MDSSPLELAVNAEEVAYGLYRYLDEVPRCAVDITADIGLLFQISSVLRDLDDVLSSSLFGLASGSISRDLDIFTRSLQATLDAINVMFERPRFAPDTGRSRSDEFWADLSRRFEQEDQPLKPRLTLYHEFIRRLKGVFMGEANRTDIEGLRYELVDLFSCQELFETYEEVDAVDEPIGNPQPRQNLRGNINARTWSPLPEAPPLSSPTFSSSSSQTFPSFSTSPPISPGAVTVRRHWATRVFDGRHTQTRFRAPGRRTRCHGEDEPAALEMLRRDGFIKVLEQPFDAAAVTVQLYWRSDDHRARILILTVDWLGRPLRHCIPLSALKILRDESNLQLCRVDPRNGEHDLWANLQFLHYERMVLFYCTIVAMKRHDRVPSMLEDYFQPGEKQEFGAEIRDGTFRHAFRVFRDKDSGGVRFEATALRGPMQRTPIWTAFVTEYIGRRRWMRRVAPKILSLQELRPYVFCDGYRPPQGPDGNYELRFRLETDCENFMDVFHIIRTQ